MTCFSPVHGFKKPGGGVSFSRSGAYSDLPVTLSCGQCRGCRLERSRQWAVRCLHESQMHIRNCFLTLTYDQINLPSDHSLALRDFQNFTKRLRKVAPFRFFHCGEYGDETNRPHYHALIFGQDFRKNAKSIARSHTGEKQYTSPLISEKWGLGRAVLGTLTWASAGYVARYAMKKINGPLAALHYQHIDYETGETFSVKPEYATMSRRPGLGQSWIEKYMDQTYPRDYIIINGRKARPPQYYDRQYEKYDPDGWAQLHKSRILKGIENAEEQTPDRLATREEVLIAQTRPLARSL